MKITQQNHQKLKKGGRKWMLRGELAQSTLNESKKCMQWDSVILLMTPKTIAKKMGKLYYKWDEKHEDKNGWLVFCVQDTPIDCF
jgi:hypothetical protein